MRIVVTSGAEFVSDPPLVNQRAAGAIPFKHLNPVAADCVEPVLIDQQPLRPAPAQSGRDDFVRIENTVAIFVDQPSHRIAVADQQSPFAIECQRVTPAGKFRPGGAIDVKARRQFKAIGQILRRIVRLRRRQNGERPNHCERGNEATHWLGKGHAKS
ncbi:MAG: hypothetical protein DME22_00890 [Verrucomicrobia bacterium]|nr:MAG: hypothetical protein DME22_00890 [Verrucomicrobiota bacterium]